MKYYQQNYRCIFTACIPVYIQRTLNFLLRLREHPNSNRPCSFHETINEIPFSHSILNRFWSTRFQMIDNAVLGTSYYDEKLETFYENS